MATAIETAAAPPETKNPRWSKTDRRNLKTGLLFISPWILGFLAFIAYPVYYTIRISFTRFSGFGEPLWIGLDNYERMLTDTLFWKSLYNTLYYTLLAVPIGVAVAMVLAIAMNRPLREVGIYRSSLVLPSVLPLFAVSFIFLALFDPVTGIVNRFMGIFGVPSVNWFGDPATAKLGLVMLAQLGAGQIAIIFLAGLKGIPLTLYEAAEIDGAEVLAALLAHHAADDDPDHPLRHHPRAEPGATGLHPGIHHRQLGGGSGSIPPHLRELPVSQRLPLQPDGVCRRPLLGAVHHHLPAGLRGVPLVAALGPLRDGGINERHRHPRGARPSR